MRYAATIRNWNAAGPTANVSPACSPPPCRRTVEAAGRSAGRVFGRGRRLTPARAIENNPSGEIIIKIDEAVRHACGYEDDVARSEAVTLAGALETAATAPDDIDLV